MSADYGFDYDHAILPTEGSQIANHLLRELMVAMGKPLIARPQSPREVWLECLDEIESAASSPEGTPEPIPVKETYVKRGVVMVRGIGVPDYPLAGYRPASPEGTPE